MPFQDFKNQQIAQQWDADTISYNPSRPEQLDMLLTIIADEYQPGNTVLDLGIGSGLIEEMLFTRVPQAQLVGVDASAAMIALADERLSAFSGQYVTLQHDFTKIVSLKLPERTYQIVFSVQTLHHLTDEQMTVAYGYIHDLLEKGGLFLLLDRIAVDKAGLFSVYQSLWHRQDSLQGSKVSSSEGQTFDEHQHIVAERGDMPMNLERHLELLKQAGFQAACVHLQTNRALIAARKS
jgi:ubiquinone/menaquinone biosynthesis C-methylase UbiE